MKKLIVLICLGLCGCTTAVPQSGLLTVAANEKITYSQDELLSVISVFSQSIARNPNSGGSYYNRAIAYYYYQDYDSCWRDVHKAQELGYEFDRNFISALKKASQREE